MNLPRNRLLPLETNLHHPRIRRQGCKRLISLRKWSGRVDLNHRPPGPEESGVKNLSAASGVAYGTFRPFTLPLNWTDDGLKFIRPSAVSSASNVPNLLAWNFELCCHAQLRKNQSPEVAFLRLLRYSSSSGRALIALVSAGFTRKAPRHRGQQTWPSSTVYVSPDWTSCYALPSAVALGGWDSQSKSDCRAGHLAACVRLEFARPLS